MEEQKLIAKRPMKVLMIAPTPFFIDRGCHIKILEELKALSKRGIKVVLVTYHLGRNIPGFEIRRIIKIPWYRKVDAGPSFQKYYLDLLLCFKALVVALKFKPDVIHAHLHEGVFVGKFVKFFIRKPILADYQGSMVAEMLDHGFIKKDSFAFKFNRFLENMINKWPDIVIFSSRQSKENFLENFPMSPEKVLSFMEGTNTEFFHPGYDVENLRKSLRLPENKKIVIYLGILTNYQGVDLLIRSIPEVIKRYRDVHFLIVGFPDVEYYADMAKKLGVNSSVTFTGRVPYEDSPRYLNLADIAVSLKVSLTEANGKLFGYMAIGLPVVVFDSEINREILGDTGLYAKFADIDSFVEKLVYLLENKDTAKELGQLARQRILDNFTWDNTFSNFIPVYQNLISENSRR
jgi:glycosyltransferase involved in cell wall biosynthesis